MSLALSNERTLAATMMPAVSTPPPSLGASQLREPLAVPTVISPSVVAPSAVSEAEAARQKRRRERRLEMNRLAARNRRRRQRDLLEDLAKTVEDMKETNLRLREENKEMKKQIQELAILEKQKQSQGTKMKLCQKSDLSAALFKLAAEMAAEREEEKATQAKCDGIEKKGLFFAKDLPFAVSEQEVSSPKSTATMKLFASDHIGVHGLPGKLSVRSPALAFPPQQSNMKMALEAAVALRAAQYESLKQQLLVFQAEEKLRKLSQAHQMMMNVTEGTTRSIATAFSQ